MHLSNASMSYNPSATRPVLGGVRSFTLALQEAIRARRDEVERLARLGSPQEPDIVMGPPTLSKLQQLAEEFVGPPKAPPGRPAVEEEEKVGSGMQGQTGLGKRLWLDQTPSPSPPPSPGPLQVPGPMKRQKTSEGDSRPATSPARKLPPLPRYGTHEFVGQLQDLVDSRGMPEPVQP